jgi:serine-type D-Ala-D-Ala carboxypeptidase/endopeptidase (penicillin-binding protein 4)
MTFRGIRSFSLAVAIIFIGSCGTGTGPHNHIAASVHNDGSSVALPQPRALESVFTGLGPEEGVWGVFAQTLSRGKSLVERNQDFLFIPASNMKLFTTAVALVRLGPDFRYVTRVYTDGVVNDGVLSGTLFLRGSGDPTLSRPFYRDPREILEEWAGELKDQGIDEISGNIVGDSSLFDDIEVGEGWSFDDDLFCYSARISALSFDNNCFDVVVKPGTRTGERAGVTSNPDRDSEQIRNDIVTSEAGGVTDLRGKRIQGSPLINFTGQIAFDATPRRFRMARTDPALHFVNVFREVLEKKGIRVGGRTFTITSVGRRPDYDGLEVLVIHQSPPLTEIIEQTNKLSQNLYAELLFRTLGAVFGREGSTKEARSVMEETLETMRIKKGSLSIHDGSGLSRLNLVSPRHVCQLLAYMAHHPYFNDFYRSLPAAGKDGTLVGRLRTRDSERQIRAKTGTLTHVAALSGYIESGQQGLIAFSILSNNSVKSGAEVRALQDRVCQKITDLALESK